MGKMGHVQFERVYLVLSEYNVVEVKFNTIFVVDLDT